MIDTEQLLEQVKKGVPIGDILAALAPEPAPASGVDLVLRRSALVRSFDRPLYKALLAKDVAAPPFEEFVGTPGVESLVDGVSYYVGDSIRRNALAAWTQDRSQLVAFSAELVKYYVKQSSAIDVFTHRLIADPDAALKELGTLYGQADDQFDLAACHALLLLVRNRLNLLEAGSPLRSDLTRRERYLQSRTLFADDYYRTVSFLQRTSLEDGCTRFLKNDKKWIFQIHGKGGTGKTMFVRWLISRQLVKEHDGKRIAVARLDFDRLDLAAFAHSPWLILPAIADQIDQQLEQNAFGQLVAGTRAYVPLLSRASRDSVPAQTRQQLRDEGKLVGADTETSFISKLGALPIVVVLDTLEEPLLHYKAAVRSVLELFQRIRGKCPGLRIVLAGRYNIADRERLPKTAAVLAPGMETVSVEEFKEEESLRYLRGLRGVERADDVLKAVHAHTRGNPLELSLFAELLQSDDTLDTPAKIKAVYPISRYAYLLDRIILRIPDSQELVRWVLRYAVVPRTLTRRYFDAVLAPNLPREVSGSKPLDQPNDFSGSLKQRYGKKTVWKRTARRPAAHRVWTQLTRYASSASWLTASTDALHLQPELMNPMRDLLQQQSESMFRNLHQQSAEYFERLARTQPDRWVEHTVEALYHRFQLDGRKAIPRFHRAMANSRAADPAVRERLAGLLLEPEFLDPESLQPRVHSRTGTIVDPALCAEAAFDVCVAGVMQRLRLTRQQADAESFEERLAADHKRLERLAGPTRSTLVPPHRRKLIEGAVTIFKRNLPAGVRLIKAALAVETRRDLRLLGELMLARSVQSDNPATDDRHFAAARRLSVATKSLHFPAWWVDYRWGLRNLEWSEFLPAADRLQGALLKMLKARPLPTESADCLRRAIQAYLETGDHAGARRMLTATVSSPKGIANAEIRAQYLISSAQLNCALFDVAAAQVDVARLREETVPNAGIVSELEGDVAALLLQTQAVDTHYLTATQMYSGWSLRGQMNCHLKRARYYLEVLQHGPTARTLLSDTEDSQDPWTHVERHLLGARFAALTGNQQPYPSPGRLTPAQSARLRGAVLSVGGGTRAQQTAFLNALGKIPSGPMRGEVLREFAATTWKPETRNLTAAARLRRLVRLEPRAPEFPLHACQLAAALTHFGDVKGARAVLKRGLRGATEPFLRERLLRALASLNGETFSNLSKAFPATSKFRETFATLSLEEAERRLADHNYKDTQRLLRDIEPEVDLLGTDTVWHVRRAELMGVAANGVGDHPGALGWYQTALSCAERGENRRAESRIKAHVAAVPKGGRPPTAFLEVQFFGPATVVRLQATTSSFVFDISRPRGPVQHFSRPTDVHPGAPPSLFWALGAPSAQSWRLVIDLLQHSGPQVSTDAAGMFSEASIDGTSDVAIAYATERQLAAFPWELGFQPSERRVVYRTSEAGRRETIVWVQRALRALGQLKTVDGVLGPETENAIVSTLPEDTRSNAGALKKALRERAPDPRPRRVLVLRSAMEDERQLRRGHGRAGTDVAQIYRGSRLEVTVVEYRSVEELQERVSFGPDLIHIVSGFIEPSSTREICLDLAQLGNLPQMSKMKSADSGSVPALTASHFKVFLERRPRNEPAPFIVLETPLPDDNYERARQVMMRNAFASELMAFARTTGVLATGLFPDATLLGRYREFVELMAGNPTQRRLYAVASAQIASEFPPALFTADPDLPILF